MKFSPTLIVELHAALRRKNIGGKLPYGSLVAFLRWGHDRAVVGWAPERIDSVVESILHDIEISEKIQNIVTTKTASGITDGPVDLRPFVSGMRVVLTELKDYLKAQAKAIREQHGGILKHDSIKDINEQIFAIHAEQMATGNSGGIDYAEKCIKLIDEALAVSS
ncbi:hypothetical protein VE00_08557 [Pseudogymnoascus sp. WSF 3629]|nr:hypothetical protein VE00_08557 [Pseudogymnoascus sp. WSF 3629]